MPRPSHIPADAVAVPLGGKRAGGRVAWVSPQDAERVLGHRWHFAAVQRTNGYVSRSVQTAAGVRKQYLHRFIMRPPAGMVVDHISGNRYDNTRGNLRICTPAQNSRNQRPQAGCSSRFKGVSARGAKWTAAVYVGGTRHHLGTYDTPEQAALAYNAAALRLHGEFACLNEIPSTGDGQALRPGTQLSLIPSAHAA